ncbi:MAG: sugar ABC transporter ATP-binding protein [Lachnospiraceae bacterium]|nr:sugar ABC transporter ATP-binding protein [Lachnospiraceae bacterium]MDY5648939.1 sugar ABC transporter ATP-binding protein [Lachnospiraceae bacterium]
MKPILEVKDIDKAFVGVHAVDHVSFSCLPGTVHVLQGENGAGKSTLLKILSGMYHPDSGEIFLNGTAVQFRHPIDAQKKGIAMVYQEMSIFPELTVAQNIFINQEEQQGKKSLFIDEKGLIENTVALASRYGIEVDPYATAGDLPIASQQMVEILKALSYDPDILILDEPTSTLTKSEVQKLHTIVKGLTDKGKTILFISHRMEEVFQFGDYATVLKDGKLVDTVKLSDVTEEDIIRMMVGRDLQEIFPPKPEKVSDEILLHVEKLNDNGHIHDISLDLRKGEVLGIGALDGQGQTEMLQTIAGVRHRSSGTVCLNGEELKYQGTNKAIKNGIGYVPENRKVQALCLKLSVRENLALASMYLRQKLGFADKKEEDKMVDKYIGVMNIKTPTPDQQVGNLSGGNQQKVSIGKTLASHPKVLLLNEPTRGIDVEAKQEIYRLIRKEAEEGIGVIMFSSDMMEVIGLSDRVITMYEGRITGELSGDEIKEEIIMRGAMNLKKNTTGGEDHE